MWSGGKGGDNFKTLPIAIVEKALAYLSIRFESSIETEKIQLADVYPYIFEKYEKPNIECSEENIFNYLGRLYETVVPVDVKKDLGQFYTHEDAVIELMLDSVDILSGKILEPSCGTGAFLVKIIKRIILTLKEKEYSDTEILEYVCENVHANDNDANALIITEVNVLAILMPLIVTARKENAKFIMPPLTITNVDFVQKSVFPKEYSLIIGNPPFVTMYGKRSRNMNEEKRAYYNTFDFVQNKKGNNKFNLSMFFIENGLKLLKSNGCLNFILDIAFFETAFIDMRKYIVQNFYINSLITGLQEFQGVASGQVIISIKNEKKYNQHIKMIDYSTGKTVVINQAVWDNAKNRYKFNAPLNKIQQQINSKIDRYEDLEKYFPQKALRTCCALTGKTEEFIVQPEQEKTHMVFPYIEGSKGLKGKFFAPTPGRYIKYDYELQLKLSDEFKEELEELGVKNKKRVTLGDKEAYLAPKIFIRQSAREIIATYCCEPYAANNSIYILTTKETTEESKNMLKYICGLLNSELITFYCRINKIIRDEKGKTPQIKISDLKNIKINVNNDYYMPIIDLVEKMLENPDDKVSYQKLNSLVYKLYDIDEKEQYFITEYLMA